MVPVALGCWILTSGTQVVPEWSRGDAASWNHHPRHGSDLGLLCLPNLSSPCGHLFLTPEAHSLL